MEITALEEKLPEISNINNSLCERATALAGGIKDRATLEEAVTHGKEIDRRLKWWETEFIGPLVESAHKAWKMATERRESVAAPLRRAKISLSSAIGFYKAEEETKRLEAEAALRAEMRKKAEDEKLNVAATLEEAGLKEEAHAVLETPVSTPPVVLPRQTDTDGSYTRTNWKFRIVDEAKIPRKYLIPDLKAIGQVVRAMKDRTDIEGIEVQKESAEAFRS